MKSKDQFRLECVQMKHGEPCLPVTSNPYNLCDVMWYRTQRVNIPASSSAVDQPCLDPQSTCCQELGGVAQVFFFCSRSAMLRPLVHMLPGIGWYGAGLLLLLQSISHAKTLSPHVARNWVVRCRSSSSSSFSVVVCLFAFPSCISGVHHFWVRFLRMWPFFNPTIKVVTFRLHGWCVLGVFLLPAFARLGHERQDLLSPCNEMHVCTD